MSRIPALLCLTCAGLACSATAADVEDPFVRETLEKGEKIAVWPEERIPGQKGKTSFCIRSSTDRRVLIGDVNVPELTCFLAKGAGAKPAVVICPGGGYELLAYGHEGTEVAEWLRGQGISSFVLKYRCPKQREMALADVQRAMSVVRARAKEWNVDAARLGIMGFSAGANLAVRVSTNWKSRAYVPIDGVDEVPCRPDFTVVVYPWMLVWGDHSERPAALPLSLRGDFPVGNDTPPAFIVQSMDDLARVENAFAYALTLKYAGVRAELHLFPDGGHGYGLKKNGAATDGWEKLLSAWFKRESSSRSCRISGAVPDSRFIATGSD